MQKQEIIILLEEFWYPKLAQYRKGSIEYERVEKCIRDIIRQDLRVLN